MKCMEARRRVTRFVNKDLSEKEAEDFLKHIEECDECMEELEIYFTVHEALDTLDLEDPHKEYNFKKMLMEEIHRVRRQIISNRILGLVRGLVFIIAEILLIVSITCGYEVRKGQERYSIFQNVIQQIHSSINKDVEYESEVESEVESET